MQRLLVLFCAMLLCGLSSPAVTAAPAPDYAHAPGMGPLLHWARVPVCVYFVPGGAATPEREKRTRAGFDEWVMETLGAIRYRVVTDPAQADLVVRFVAAATVPGGPGAVGHTLLTHAGPLLVRADMALATAGIPPDELEQTAAHEFGHALGLNGHSDDPADMMYPTATRLILPDGTSLPALPRFVTTRDLNTLWLCYPDLRPRPVPQAGGTVSKRTR